MHELHVEKQPVFTNWWMFGATVQVVVDWNKKLFTKTVKKNVCTSSLNKKKIKETTVGMIQCTYAYFCIRVCTYACRMYVHNVCIFVNIYKAISQNLHKTVDNQNYTIAFLFYPLQLTSADDISGRRENNMKTGQNCNQTKYLSDTERLNRKERSRRSSG